MASMKTWLANFWSFCCITGRKKDLNPWTCARQQCQILCWCSGPSHAGGASVSKFSRLGRGGEQPKRWVHIVPFWKSPSFPTIFKSAVFWEILRCCDVPSQTYKRVDRLSTVGGANGLFVTKLHMKVSMRWSGVALGGWKFFWKNTGITEFFFMTGLKFGNSSTWTSAEFFCASCADLWIQVRILFIAKYLLNYDRYM